MPTHDDDYDKGVMDGASNGPDDTWEMDPGTWVPDVTGQPISIPSVFAPDLTTLPPTGACPNCGYCKHCGRGAKEPVFRIINT